MDSTLDTFDPLDFCLWGHINFLCMQLLFTTKRHFTIVGACQNIHNYPDDFERMRQSMVRCVEEFLESRGGYYEHLL